MSELNGDITLDDPKRWAECYLRTGASGLGYEELQRLMEVYKAASDLQEVWRYGVKRKMNIVECARICHLLIVTHQVKHPPKVDE